MKLYSVLLVLFIYLKSFSQDSLYKYKHLVQISTGTAAIVGDIGYTSLLPYYKNYKQTISISYKYSPKYFLNVGINSYYGKSENSDASSPKLAPRGLSYKTEFINTWINLDFDLINVFFHQYSKFNFYLSYGIGCFIYEPKLYGPPEILNGPPTSRSLGQSGVKFDFLQYFSIHPEWWILRKIGCFISIDFFRSHSDQLDGIWTSWDPGKDYIVNYNIGLKYKIK